MKWCQRCRRLTWHAQVMTCYELPKSKGTSKIFLDTKYIRLIQKPHTLAALSRQNKPTPRGTMAVHLKNNTRVGEEEGAVLTDVTNQKAVATIATFIRAPRDHPLSAGSPVSFWSNCFIQANPKTGQLLELVQTSLSRSIAPNNMTKWRLGRWLWRINVCF